MSSADKLTRKRALLTPEKQALLEKRLRGNWPAGPTAEGLARSQVMIPVVSSQKRQGPLEVDWATVVESGFKQSAEVPAQVHTLNFTKLSPALNGLCFAYVCAAFQQLGIFTRVPESHSVDRLMREHSILPVYRKLLCRWLKMLVEAGFLKQDGEDFINQLPLPATSPALQSEEIREAVKATEYAEIIDSLSANGENLVAIITGRETALENLFSGDFAKGLELAYQFTPEARYFISIIREILVATVQSLPPERQLRVLEVGAGIGATSASLLPVMPEGGQYVFSDISAYFLENARGKFGPSAMLNYTLLNIDENPLDHGYAPHNFDIIVASNVLHCARLLGKSLGYLRSLLCTGGLMLILEGTRNENWHTVAMGLLKGYFNFEDERLSEGQPLLSPSQWQEMLTSQGFKDTIMFPERGSSAESLGQNVFVARAP